MIDSEEKNYLWQHFVFNAEQRLKAFNFFVIFSFFANGGVFAAAEKNLHGAVFILIGTFVAMSIVFWVIDARSQGLLQLAAPGLKDYESRFPEHSRLFKRDADRKRQFIRYTNAFRVLFSMQLLFGLGVIAYEVFLWL